MEDIKYVNPMEIKKDLQSESDSTIIIFYVTIGLMVLFILFWLLLVYMTQDGNINILTIMNDPSFNIKSMSDIPKKIPPYN